jgi:hypothetical protein
MAKNCASQTIERAADSSRGPAPQRLRRGQVRLDSGLDATPRELSTKVSRDSPATLRDRIG